MTNAVEAIDLPFDEAIRFFRDKASVTTKSWTDVYAASHSRMFMVAGAATDALVSDFRREIERALTEGATIADFRKSFDDIVARNGWEYNGSRNWRTRIIFDTNLRTAYAAGRYSQLTAPDTLDVFPFWQYNHSGAIHPRKEHQAWDGLVLAADDTFWRTNYPPNGWHCGCFVTPVSAPGLRRQGKSGPDASPDLVFRAEEVGGKTVRVPQGVDPGFEYNPGIAWLSRTTPGSKTVGAAPGRIVQFVQSAVAGSRPSRSYVPVAIAPDNIAKAFDVPVGTEIRLSADTITRHLHHPEATAEVYSTFIEEAMERGKFYELNGRVTMLVEKDGEVWLSGMKRTASGEIYVNTLHRTRAGQARRIMRDGKYLTGGN